MPTAPNTNASPLRDFDRGYADAMMDARSLIINTMTAVKTHLAQNEPIKLALNELAGCMEGIAGVYDPTRVGFDTMDQHDAHKADSSLLSQHR